MPPRSPPADPEVVPKRRRYSTQEKLRILAAADACTEPGRIGELLRKEGIYSSNLSRWRAQLARSGREGFADQKRGRKPDPNTELQRLIRENQRLQERLARAETIIDVQKKVSEILGIPLPTDEKRLMSAATHLAAKSAPSSLPRPRGRARRALSALVSAPPPEPKARPRRRAPSRPRSGRRCSTCCTASGSSTARRRRSTRRCSTRAVTSARSARCTASWPPSTARSASVATSCGIRPTPSRSCWPAAQPGLELGHHQAPGPGQVDLLLPVRHPRRLQPLRRRLDWSAPRERASWPSADRRDRAEQQRIRREQLDRPRRPRQLDDAASRSRSCSPTWASPRPTAGRTSRTTTRSRRRSSRR